MPKQKPFFQEFKTKIAKFEFEYKKFWKEAWPIDFSFFKKPSVLFSSFLNASYLTKTVVISSSVALIISLSFSVFSTYLLLTVETKERGGNITEAVLEAEGVQMTIFNPVLQTFSEAERRVNQLLFHPLYEVDYPNFAKSQNQKPEINPILLFQEPSWIPNSEGENDFKKLNFILRDDIKWSDGSKITASDVEYTFERLKEEGGNQDFNDILNGLEIQTISTTEFLIISQVSNPGLIYSLNFKPISKNYFKELGNLELQRELRSRNPVVTSGYFILPDKVMNPELDNQNKVSNPIKKFGIDEYEGVVLKSNPIQNYEDVFVDSYFIKVYKNILNESGEGSSIEKDAKNGKIDLFTRNLNSNLQVPPEDVVARLGLEQTIIPTNTYYVLYLNIAPQQYFINHNLRKYTLCSLIEFDAVNSYSQFLNPIPINQALTPIEINTETEANCTNSEQELLDTNIYTIQNDRQNQIKRVLVKGSEMSFTMISLGDNPLAQRVQSHFTSSGLPVNLVSNSAQALDKLESGDYNIAFIPITIASRDPYNIFGAKGRNISNIISNSRVSTYAAERNLELYSQSFSQNQDAKDKLVDFFSSEYLNWNLYQVKKEYNYSPNLKGVENNIPGIETFLVDQYRLIPELYVETKRVFKF